MSFTVDQIFWISVVFDIIGVICIVFSAEISKRIPWIRSSEDTRKVVLWTVKIGVFGTIVVFIGVLLLFVGFVKFIME
jgi:hypothetical protein